jgi:hypothetical protein
MLIIIVMITTIKLGFTQLRAARARGVVYPTLVWSARLEICAVGSPTTRTRAMDNDYGTWRPLIPEKQRFSRTFRGRGDHLFVSDGLIKAVQTVTTGKIEIRSLTEQPTERRESRGRDHRLVGAVFDPGQ